MKVIIGTNTFGLEKGIPDLKSEYPQAEFFHCASREDMEKHITDADVYLGWISRDALLKAKNLKWIQSPSSGVDNFLTIPELVENEVLLTSAVGTHGACLAESVLGMILAFNRGIRASILCQKEHVWAIREIRPKQIELTGSTMGIIGFGVVGRSLAKRAYAFDMRIIAVDLYPKNKPDHVDKLWGMEHLNDLLKESDYVVVAVPYTPDTKGMIGTEQLALMKPSAMLVVISRGGVVDQVALAQALKEKRIASAALDVVRPEPLPEDSELWDMENVLITPHIAGGTQYEGQHILSIFRENLGRLLRGELPLRNQADKKRGF
jgi:D-2-hydroxyacid dehydrogenase (NADP+)